MRSESVDLRVLWMSDNLDNAPEYRDDAYSAFLAKPFFPNTLLTAVRNMLNVKRPAHWRSAAANTLKNEPPAKHGLTLSSEGPRNMLANGNCLDSLWLGSEITRYPI